MVGHAPTVEGCTRQLTGNRPRSTEEFVNVTRKVPFLSIIQCEKNIMTGQWSLAPPPVPAMRHLCLEEFDWNNLNTDFNHNLNNTYNNYNMTIENLGYNDGSGGVWPNHNQHTANQPNAQNYAQPQQHQQHQQQQPQWCY